MKKKVAIVAVHPDDETLGCGGTALRLIDEGASVYWIIVTAMLESEGFSKERISERNEEIARVSEAYGFAETIELRYPAAKLDTLPLGELVGSFSDAFSRIEPNQVFLPYWYDAHSDHHVTFQAAYSATKIFRHPSIRSVHAMEVVSETDFAVPLSERMFVPNTLYDISQFLDKKLEIMKIYRSEIDQHPFPRSIENIERHSAYRGTHAGCEYAEAFMQLRSIR